MLYVITGPPAAGKTTWVHGHAQHGDIVIDYDTIAVALTVNHSDDHVHPAQVKTVTKAARRAAIEAALPLADTVDVYLIHSTPSASQLDSYREHGARIITIDPGKDVVLDRISETRPWQLTNVAKDYYKPKPETQSKPQRSIAKPPTTTQRGYGSKHQNTRKRHEATVRAGNATCWRCGQPIKTDEPWDLGHDDTDRTKYRGPEHVKCNRGAPRRQAHGADTSRKW
ncbi:polynucleotide kinase [Gordonia phage OneDirection]|nr:polynucleotide kinase [Gordonia phage OneDirection]